MTQNGKNENILQSWKEISAYVGRDVRTCIRWEKQYGLPVHRLEAEARGKIFAYRDEIDEWLRHRAGGETTAKPAPGRHRWPFAAATALLVIGVLAALLFHGKPGRAPASQSRVPFDFHIKGSNLVIVNAEGGELWRNDLGLPSLQLEDNYRGHFQEKTEEGNHAPVWPELMIKDIDADGRVETLFSIQTKDESREGALICFDDKGGKRWHFDAGRALTFGDTLYRRDYRIAGIDLADFDGDGKSEIIVFAWQKPDWPCQVAVLDASTGALRCEYWNKGYFDDYLSEDIDGDGQKETVLSGVNNEYNKGCLAIFKGLRIGGVSPQDFASWRTTDLDEGTEIAYILCPDTFENQAVMRAADALNSISPHNDGDGFEALATTNEVHFDFDRHFRCIAVRPSNVLRDKNRELLAAGKIRNEIDQRYLDTLRDGLLYREGERWVRHPFDVVGNARKPQPRQKDPVPSRLAEKRN